MFQNVPLQLRPEREGPQQGSLSLDREGNEPLTAIHAPLDAHKAGLDQRGNLARGGTGVHSDRFRHTVHVHRPAVSERDEHSELVRGHACGLEGRIEGGDDGARGARDLAQDAAGRVEPAALDELLQFVVHGLDSTP